jgi:hypothetical protein
VLWRCRQGLLVSVAPTSAQKISCILASTRPTLNSKRSLYPPPSLHSAPNTTQEYFCKLLADRWGVPLIACVPDSGFLGQPTLADLEDYFCGTLLTGHRDRRGHYPLERAHLVSSPSKPASEARLGCSGCG